MTILSSSARRKYFERSSFTSERATLLIRVFPLLPAISLPPPTDPDDRAWPNARAVFGRWPVRPLLAVLCERALRDEPASLRISEAAAYALESLPVLVQPMLVSRNLHERLEHDLPVRLTASP